MRWCLFVLFLLPANLSHAFTHAGLALFIQASVTPDEVYVDRDRRAEMAEAIMRYWDNADTRLPRLAPSELQWLNGELTAVDQRRRARAMMTKEYHLAELASIVDQCKLAAATLTDAYRDVDALKFEMIKWTDVAACYHASNGAIFEHLSAVDLLTRDESDDGYLADDVILTTILTVVIPSAMADAMDWTLAPE